MRTLAMDHLFQKIEEDDPPDNLEIWYQNIRNNSLEELFPFLVEDTGRIEKVFIIHKSDDKDFVQVRIEEMRPEISCYLPFVKNPGSRNAQIGPVFKRNYNKNKISPSKETINSTIKYFKSLAESDKLWSAYFKEIFTILKTPKIKMNGAVINWETEYESLLECVIQEIGQLKKTAIVTVEDSTGKLPGQRPDYLKYLLEDKLAGNRYLTKKIQAKEDSACPLCGTKTKLFPNALKGAGLNLLNMDRLGAFPGIDKSQAWKGYALCVSCADLLYVYKNHVLKKTGPKKDRIPFSSKIAGDRAIIIPFSTVDARARQELLTDVKQFIRNIPDDVEEDEETLLDILKDEKALLSLTFLWADIGQNLEKVRWMLTDVPPSRLRELSQINEQAEEWKHPLFPELSIDGKFNMKPDLSLRALFPMFHRPGKKAKDANQSKKLFQLKRLVASAVYHKAEMPEKLFWNEILTTAQWWWLDTIERGDTYGLLYEGKGKKGPYLTAAGWVRNLAWWLYYFKQAGALDMENEFYEPEWEELRPYLGGESGIDKKEKAFAFLLGVVYGRLIFVQEMAGVRVSVLNWVRRFTIDGKDLPELCKKILAKLLEYRHIPDEKIRKLFTKKYYKAVEELALIGDSLGDKIDLSSNLTCYYLLLGLSLSNKILKKREE